MRLKSIKLAGFKSFVDATNILLPTNLTAIVGPNGCGKSNIIDAVRWVMGESSAKQLRGESLDDVIFNGSGGRKPVGQASIELLFDNSKGTLTGQYASYGEIEIRREITRDGQSSYYLNNGKCRRRDITDLFLGTGLGPRSYAIIEQGMISRLIEAKSDDMRGFIEEAAGISKYKERRKETESRIHHTEENMARLNDIREELAKQLNHLERQAQAAERYQILKQDERLTRAQMLALRWQQANEHLQQQQSRIQASQEELSAAVHAQQELEAGLENFRNQHAEALEKYNEVQSKYYQVNHDLTSTEQKLNHHRERYSEWENENQEIAQTVASTEEQLEAIFVRHENLTQEIQASAPKLQQAQDVSEKSKQKLAEAELSLQTWQKQYETLNQQIAQTAQRAEVEQTRISHLQQQIKANQERVQRLETEKTAHQLTLENVASEDLTLQLEEIQEQKCAQEELLQNIIQAIKTQREQNHLLAQQLDQARNNLQTLRGQQASLESLQEVALGQKEEQVMTWLKQYQLTDFPRLAQLLQVEAGWEQAVEIVLERHLQAVCVDELAAIATSLEDLPKANVSLFARKNNLQTRQHATFTLLQDKIQAPFSLASLLEGIYVAENLTIALEKLSSLAAHESIITKDGTWLGNGWIYVGHKADAKTGILQRERELQTLRENIEMGLATVEEQQIALDQGNHRLHELENQREQEQHKISELIRAHADIGTQQKIQQAHLNQAEQRLAQVQADLEECNYQLENNQTDLMTAESSQQEAQTKLTQMIKEHEALQLEKMQHQDLLEDARRQTQQDQEVMHQFELQLQAAKLQYQSAEQEQHRLQQQRDNLHKRQENLKNMLAEGQQPLSELAEQLAEFVEQKAVVQELLTKANTETKECEQTLQQLEQQRHSLERQSLEKRNALEEVRLAGQAHELKAKGIEEQLSETEYELPKLLEEMPEEANESAWEEKLQQIVRKVERLGPINLAAIDECQTLNERKTYLDTQYVDLEEALNTLHDAMQKMDQETKSRFKETFETINANFQRLFPTLFGGGNASLQLLDTSDLLTSGVSVMAQPPGKRNSTIHLLSGGEKALTAISLVFALFQLNPAPFCILDEVDAPLDDANVGRFCNLVKQMASDVQFIFISHNKLAIEMAEQLAGVTMQEPGVSRMVAVDIEEAIAMATA